MCLERSSRAFYFLSMNFRAVTFARSYSIAHYTTASSYAVVIVIVIVIAVAVTISSNLCCVLVLVHG